MARSRLRLAALKRFAHAYYVGNALVVASYWPLRRLMAEAGATEGPHARLFTYERQAALMMAASFAMKARRWRGGSGRAAARRVARTAGREPSR